MKKRHFLWLLFFVIIIISIFFYNNYRRNQTIIYDNSILKLQNKDALLVIDLNKNKLFTEEMGSEVLEEISSIKKESINSFLKSTNKKIIFNPASTDTLKLRIKVQKMKYTSVVEYGHFDVLFSDFLTDRIMSYIRAKNINSIDYIEIYTLQPTEIKNFSPPPPPDALTNY